MTSSTATIRPNCMCPVCRISRALATIDRAHDDWLDQSTEHEMALAHLHDEVAAVLATPWWRWPFQRDRLRQALVNSLPMQVGRTAHSGS